MMRWLPLLILAAIALAVLRIMISARRRRAERPQSWEERRIRQLRDQGLDPFSPHEVDFFFDLPDQDAANRAAQALTVEGFTTDMHPMRIETGERISLHARKSMRITVDEISDLSRRLTTLAQQHGGRYDGWMVHRGTSAAS